MLDGSLSFGDVTKTSGQMKAVTTAKQLLLQEVALQTWEQVETSIPEFASEDVLGKFQLQKGKPPPKSFKVGD